MTKRRFVALDRDGTLMVEKNYLRDAGEVQLLPNVVQGLRRMRNMGLGLVVVTNQSGIGRGYYDLANLVAVHARLNALLAEEGVTLDGIYFCPHLPEDGCDCRKPEPGMLRQAAAEHGFAVEQCFVIGDKACDVDLAKRVGAMPLLVRTGYGAPFAAEGKHGAAYVVDDLDAAAGVIEDLLKA